jgi:hypothetical protein
MAEKCQRCERHTSYHKLNLCTAQIFHGTVFYTYMYVLFLGIPTLPFTFHGLILLLIFRFLWCRLICTTSVARNPLEK